MFATMVVTIQGVLLFVPVFLALLITTVVSTSSSLSTAVSPYIRHSFSLSRRGLSWFRVACGFAILLDIATRFTEIDVWNSDDGLVSREKKLQLCSQESSQPTWATTCNWSIHMATGSHTGQTLLLLIHSTLAIMLIIGWRARETALILYLYTESLHNFARFSTGSVGGDFLKVSLFWAWQLPIEVNEGRRSRRSRRSRMREEKVSSSNYQDHTDEMVFTPATCCFVLTFCIIYWDCVVARMDHPTHSAWLDGTALRRAVTLSRYRTANYYVVHLDNIPNWLFQIGTWGALFMEAICPFLLLTRGKFRNIAVTCFATLFLGIYVLMDLGQYSFLCSISLVPFLFSSPIFDDGDGDSDGDSDGGGDGDCDGGGGGGDDSDSDDGKKKATAATTQKKKVSTRAKSKGRKSSKKKEVTSPAKKASAKKARDDGDMTPPPLWLPHNHARNPVLKSILKSVLLIFALSSLWIGVATHVCYSSATFAAAIPGCAAAQSILPTVWTTPLSHGPWRIFSGFENYRDWRLLQLMSNATTDVDPLDPCRQQKQQHDVYTCLLAIGQQEKLVSLVPHASNLVVETPRTLSDHIQNTALVPAKDSFESFWWQNYWETMYFLDGAIEKAYSAAASFHCRRSSIRSSTSAASATSGPVVLPKQRFYLLLMMQQGEGTSQFCHVSLASCECGKCQPQDEGGEHSMLHVSNIPLKQMNLPLSQYLLDISSKKEAAEVVEVEKKGVEKKGVKEEVVKEEIVKEEVVKEEEFKKVVVVVEEMNTIKDDTDTMYNLEIQVDGHHYIFHFSIDSIAEQAKEFCSQVGMSEIGCSTLISSALATIT